MARRLDPKPEISPQTLYILDLVSIGTTPDNTSSRPTGTSVTTRPLPSIIAEMPVLTERTMDVRVSIHRKTLAERWVSCSSEPRNQPSFEIFTKKSTLPVFAEFMFFVKNRRTTCGTVSSKQISGAMLQRFFSDRSRASSPCFRFGRWSGGNGANSATIGRKSVQGMYSPKGTKCIL